MWTIDQAIKTLGRSQSVSAAAVALKTTPAALRSGFKRAREAGASVGSPADHIRAPRATPAIQRILVCPDVHIPFHDEQAWSTFLGVLHTWKPDGLVCLGDMFDFYEVSDFTKSPDRKHNFKSEIAIGNREADRLAGPWWVEFMLGNHEDRLDRFIAKRAPELHGLTSVPEIFHFADRGWNWHAYGEQFQIGKIHFAHDYGSAGARAVSQSLAATGHCVLFGHTHRAASEYSGTVDGERHVGMSCGWLGDYDSLAFSYTRRWKARREWTHGFATVTIETATGFGWAQFHPIIDGRAVVDGQVISG